MLQNRDYPRVMADGPRALDRVGPLGLKQMLNYRKLWELFLFHKFLGLLLPPFMRTKILEKATDMFLKLGFKSVTMDDLAHEMGISKKTIYASFENKTKLVQECASGLFETISNGIDHIRSLEKNPIEELYAIKKFVMGHLKNQKSSAHYQLQKYYPAVFDGLRCQQYDVMQHSVRNNVKKGIEQGMYRENLDIEFIWRIYMAGAMNIKDAQLFPPDLFGAERLTDNYLEYHLRGIVTPEGRKVLNGIIKSNHE